MMRRDEIVALTLILLVIAGMVVAFIPDVYRYDITFEENDGTVSYTYESNTGMETTTVVISNSGLYDIGYVAAYYDEGYAAKNDWTLQGEMFDDFRKQLSVRSVDGFGLYDSESLLELIETADPFTTAIMIASGSVSDAIYDGTDSCPLVSWINKGGTVINVAGCLGKYVSHGPSQSDIEEVYGYGMIFAGVDDASFNDSAKALYASAGCNEDVRDSLHFYMNEYTYGIDLSGIGNSVNLGYYSEDGYSAAAIIGFGGGMLINFGASLSTHEHYDHYMAQIVASGMDYTSEILYTDTGDTRGDNSGVVPVEGNCSVYGFIGSTRAVYAERFDVRL